MVTKLGETNTDKSQAQDYMLSSINLGNIFLDNSEKIKSLEDSLESLKEDKNAIELLIENNLEEGNVVISAVEESMFEYLSRIKRDLGIDIGHKSTELRFLKNCEGLGYKPINLSFLSTPSEKSGIDLNGDIYIPLPRLGLYNLESDNSSFYVDINNEELHFGDRYHDLVKTNLENIAQESIQETTELSLHKVNRMPLDDDVSSYYIKRYVASADLKMLIPKNVKERIKSIKGEHFRNQEIYLVTEIPDKVWSFEQYEKEKFAPISTEVMVIGIHKDYEDNQSAYLIDKFKPIQITGHAAKVLGVDDRQTRMQ